MANTDRPTLKAYFSKNRVPTEDNFAALIDSMLNQKDDGIAKPTDSDPLGIAAVGGPKKLLNFYETAGESNPAWTLQLNPRSKQEDTSTARPGFSISDGQGTSRLFIDKSTGKVGIGLTEPTRKLHVLSDEANVALLQSNSKDNAYLKLAVGNAEAGITCWPDGRLSLWNAASDVFNLSKGGNIGIGANNPASKLAIAGGLAVGSTYADSNAAPADGLLVQGNVGIGTPTPDFRLDVVDRIRIRQGTSASAGLWLYQTTPKADRAFIGMVNDNAVGLWGDKGIGWGLYMDIATGNTTIKGKLVLGKNGDQVFPKVKVYRDKEIQNAGIDSPGTMTIDYSKEFTNVYECFAIFQGHSLFASWKNGHWMDSNSIPQVVYVKVSKFNDTSATVEAYCSESKKESEVDNRVMFTLVVIGC